MIKKKRAYIFILLAGLIGFFLIKKRVKNKQPYLTINNHKIRLEIPQTASQKVKGLGNRESLPQNQGMLFVYTQPGIYSFWMKGMEFNLDFVFINQNRVVDLVENVPCPQKNEQPQTVTAKKPFDRVLEINAGVIEKYKIKIGDAVEFYF